MEVAEVQDRPRRGRPPRQAAVAETRRRRQPGTLNRMVQFKLDIIPPEDLDLQNYVYRWIDDRPGRLRMATEADDYDFVTTSELGRNFDPAVTDSESDERVRMFCETSANGQPVYTYLCKKPRSFWEADNDEVVRMREDMMAGRVYRGEATEGQEQTRDEDSFYVPTGVQVGHAGERKRGPIPRNFK